MNKNKEKLKALIESDTLGLLNLPAHGSVSETKTDVQRLVDSFQEIVQFFEDNCRLPENEDDLKELKLKARLEAIKKDPVKVKTLIDYDFYDLLDKKNTPTMTLSETLNDPLGLLDLSDEDDSIYKLKHVEKNDRLRPDFIAHRRVCRDFSTFEPVFRQLKSDLKMGKREFVEFSESDLESKSFFVLGGVLLILESARTNVQEYKYASGNRNRQDGRTRCIFDNGTESNMLFRSLGKALLKNGFTISDIIKSNELTNDGTNITDNDVTGGYIYVLKSLSSDENVRKFKDLYKIGYCTTSISERISDCKNDPTYLMADVQIVLSVKCFNLNVPNLEDAIHKFFSDVNIEFKVVGNDGLVHHPREWFAAPLGSVEQAITLIVNGNYENYYYDKELKQIIKKH